MGNVDIWQASFNGGELTPLVEGREDITRYPTGCRRLRNAHGLIQGPARRRTGGRFVAEVKNSGQAWLVPFIRSRALAYILEYGDSYIRFFRNRAPIIDPIPPNPYEVVTPWSYVELTAPDGTMNLRFTQSIDVLYNADGLRPIQQLTRSSDNDWALSDFETVGGPFESENATATTVYASAQTGTVTLTASTAIFTPDRIGSLFRIQPQDLRSVPPWEPSKRAALNNLRRAGGKTYKATVATVIGTGPYAGTETPIHEQGIEVDGSGQGLDPEDGTGQVTFGITWEFQDPGYGVLKITATVDGDDSFVKLLLHMDGADASTTFTDTHAHTFTAFGNAQIDTAQSKFGGASGLFDGTGVTCITTPDSADFTLGSSNFTVDCWFNCTAVGGTTRGIAGQSDATPTNASISFLLYRSSIGNVIVGAVSDGVGGFISVASTTQFTNLLNTGWHHVAFVRTGNVLKLFIDGVQEGGDVAFTASVNDSAQPMTIGRRGSVGGTGWIGWLDEFRMSVGIARWTSNFTPPVAAYAVSGLTATATVEEWRVGSNAQLPFETVLVGNATTRWAWGLFSEANGYPTDVSFFRERFVMANDRQYAFSVPANFVEFAQETAGQVLADNAFVVELTSDRDETTQWLKPAHDKLIIGTTGGEHMLGEMTLQQVFGPLNRKSEPKTGYGSNGVAPVRAGEQLLFVEANSLRVRATESNGDDLTAPSQNDLAEHITFGGVVAQAFQEKPDSLAWYLTAYGSLPCLTYSKEQDVFGWSQHFIGGYRDASHLRAAKITSIASIPSPDGTVDDLWYIAERYIDGGLKRYIECITPAAPKPQQWEFEPEEAFKRRILDWQADLIYLDSAATLDVPLTITGIAKVGSVLRVTVTAHPLSNGDFARIDGVMGMWQVNARGFEVENVAANTFDLVGIDAADVDDYISGGFAREMVTVVSNLDPWEGETLQVITDGAVHPDRTVSGGEITLQYRAARVHTGYNARMTVETMRPIGGNEQGSAQGKHGEIPRIILRVEGTLGGKFGPTDADLDVINYRVPADPMGIAVPVFTGDLELDFPTAGNDTVRTVVFVQDQGLPATVVSIGTHMSVQPD